MVAKSRLGCAVLQRVISSIVLPPLDRLHSSSQDGATVTAIVGCRTRPLQLQGAAKDTPVYLLQMTRPKVITHLRVKGVFHFVREPVTSSVGNVLTFTLLS